MKPPVDSATGQPAAINCPSCGRFIGPALTCPYCGATAAGRLPLRLLRYAAAVLGVGGLALLYVVARLQAPPPLTPLADIQPTMQFGALRVQGVVGRPPYVRTDARGLPAYLSFLVTDGTNEITVAASGRLAQTLWQAARWPAAGDRVEARGAVSVSPDGRTRLQVLAPEHLVLLCAAAPAGAGRRPRGIHPAPGVASPADGTTHDNDAASPRESPLHGPADSPAR